ncbi:MAG: RHS repeat-associated core domain-containing protein [Chloroflexota bacterium]
MSLSKSCRDQVKAVVGSTTTYYVGAHYQVDNGVVTKYYLAGASRIAMYKSGTLYYLLGDHLGSTSITTGPGGTKIAELRYKAWGETRYSSGTTPTKYQFTGQRNETSLGLYFYNARWYDASLGRFTSADTLVPAGVQGYDRYAYTSNNPVKYVDPSGHFKCHGSNYRCQIRMRKMREVDDESEYHAQSWWEWLWKGFDYSQSCVSSLLECYYSGENMKFGGGEQITMDEFTKLLVAVYFDLRSMDDGALPLGNNWFDQLIRSKFDTPFFNGIYTTRDGPTGIPEPHPMPNQIVCIQGITCSYRSAINYFAQGMWGAAAGETLEGTYATGQEWKDRTHQPSLTVDEKFWIEYGYNTYNQFEALGLYDALTSQ